MNGESVREAVKYSEKTLKEVAVEVGWSEQNFNNKLRRGGFGSKTDDELSKVADALGGTFYSFIEFPNGKRFGYYPNQASENKEENLERVKVKGIDIPVYKPKTMWIRASDLYTKQGIQTASLKDWVALKIKHEDENRKLMIGNPVQEGIDYIVLEEDWLLSLDLASAIDPELLKLKEK